MPRAWGFRRALQDRRSSVASLLLNGIRFGVGACLQASVGRGTGLLTREVANTGSGDPCR